MENFKTWRKKYLQEVVRLPSSNYSCFDGDYEDLVDEFNDIEKHTLRHVDDFDHGGITYEVHTNEFGDEGDYYFIDDEENGYDLMVGVRHERGYEQISHVCKNQVSDKRCLPTSAYLDYFLPMKGKLFSDVEQTPNGFNFWKTLFRKSSKRGLHFYVFDDIDEKYTPLDRVTDMDQYYGDDLNLASKVFVISEEPL